MYSFVNSNRLFGAFFCLSLLLHFAVIAGLPFEKLLLNGAATLDGSIAKEPEPVTIEFELESPPEVQKTEEEPVQEKRLNFVDTGENTIDEEPQGETDKIGVKGAIARDTYEGPEEENNQPHSEGNSTGLFLAEGDSPLAEVSPEVTETQDQRLALFNNDVFGKESQLNETEAAAASAPQNAEYKEGDSAEYKEGLEEVEVEYDPTLLARIRNDIGELQPGEAPLELADTGEIAPLIVPPKKQDQQAREAQRIETEVSEAVEKTVPDVRPVTRTPVQKKINRGGKKGSFITYEDTISNAPLSGEESFSVNRHAYAEYFEHIRKRIAWYWFLSYGHDQSIKLKTSNRLPIIIEFKVMPSGRTDDVTIIDEAGNQLLAARIQDAIQTTRLDRFPPHIEEDFIDVRFNFYFF